MYSDFSAIILLSICSLSVCVINRKPNVIFILVDDLGWNDVSWNNKDMPTPNLEKLANEGIRLDQAYSQQVCTPSRAALMTGKYPFHIGRQKRALKPLQPTGLHLNLTTLPQELKKLGYNTHIVGKWHLGYCAWEYTPTRRGFDSFLGFYLGSENHFTHDRDYKTKPDDPPTFYDFRENEKIAKKDYDGVYSTKIFEKRSKEIIANVAEEKVLNAYGNYKPFFLYLSFQATHAPLQARAETLAKIPQTGNPARDIYKAMVLDLDLAVANIVNKLKETDLYKDTLIVFTSDNGGAISHGASNFPLRGTKGTLFEGGTRATTFIHGPEIMRIKNIVSNNLVHITDWMPTILSLAGYQGDPSRELGLDGIDQWEALNKDENVRDEMVYNLKAGPISGAIRIGPHKIIFGKKFNKQGWYDTDNTALLCETFKKDKKEKRKTKKDELMEISRRQGKMIVHGRSRKNQHKKKVNKNSKSNNKKRNSLSGNEIYNTHEDNRKESSSKRKVKVRENNEHQGKKKRKVIHEENRKQFYKNNKDNKKNNRTKDKGNRKSTKNKRIIMKSKSGSKVKPKKHTAKKDRNKRKKMREWEKKKIEKEELKLEKAKRKKMIRIEKREKKVKKELEKKEKRAKVQFEKSERKRLKEEGRLMKKAIRKEEKKDQKLKKVWKDWIPSPSEQVQDIMRLRIDSCNWDEFKESGHSESLNLIPRSDLHSGGAVELIDPVINPFNISAEDEDTEFDISARYGFKDLDLSVEELFDKADIAMYNVIDDPSEKQDLRFKLPDVFSKLRSRAIYHLKNIVPEDFPPQDFSGHPSKFNGYFSPGWCEPKYS